MRVRTRRFLLAATALGLAVVLTLSLQAFRQDDAVPQPPADRQAENGARLFRTCAACHSIRRDGPDLDGPNLYGVMGSRVAQRRSRYAYTAALRDLGGTWTPEKLDRWLRDPRALVPGTSMAFPGLTDSADRADVIAYLRTMGPKAP